MVMLGLPPPIPGALPLDLTGQPIALPPPVPVAQPVIQAPAPPPVTLVPSVQPDETAPSPRAQPGPLLGAPAPVSVPVRAPGSTANLGAIQPFAPIGPDPEPQHPGLIGRFSEAAAPLREALQAGAAMVKRSRETERALHGYATEQENLRNDRAAREVQRQEALQTARDKYDSDLQRYQDRADEPLLSGGGKIALVIGAALHGLGAALSHGKLQNNAFQLVTSTLQERARQMAADDQRARERLALRHGQVEDIINQEGELHRQGELAHAALGLKLSTELQEIGARATTEVERAKYSTLAEQFQSDAMARAEKVAGDRAMAQLDAYSKRANIDKTLAETDRIRAQTAKAIGGGTPTPKVLAADADPQLREVYAQSPKEAQRIQNQGIRDPFTGKILQQPDGSFFTRAGSESEGKDLRGKMAGARKVNDLANKLLALRDKYGWEADVTRSDGWQAMQSTAGQLDLAIKDANGTGALDEGALKVIRRISGGDPTGLRDVTSSLRTLQGNTEGNLNADLGAAGYHGTFAMPKLVEAKRRTLEETGQILNAPFNRRTGDNLSAKDRIGVFEEQHHLKRAAAGGIVHGTELAVEDAQRLLRDGEQRKAVIDDEIDDILDARKAGVKEDPGDVRLKRLRAALKEEKSFVQYLDEFVNSGAKKLTEQAQAEERRSRKVESRPSGARER